MSLKRHILLLLLLISTCTVHSRSLPATTADLFSDGVHNTSTTPSSSYPVMAAAAAAAAEETCEQTYGFLPCTRKAVGNLFLIMVYGYLTFRAATYVSTGSELLLEILGPGIVGGLFLPLLGALPEAMLILVSGLFGSTTTAQRQVSAGMGLLTGSNIMVLTIIWGSCIVAGKCDITEPDCIAIDGKDTKGFHLTGSAVSTDIWTSYVARIMVISVIPFLVVQLPQFLDSTPGRHLAVLSVLVLSLTMLLSYSLYQIFQPWIQRRWLAYAKHKHVISGILKHLKQRTFGRLIREDGQPDKEHINKIFSTIDENKDDHLSASELKALIVGIQFDEIDFDSDDVVSKVMKDFDLDSDGRVTMHEFTEGIIRWLNEAMRAKSIGSAQPDPGPQTMNFLNDFHMQTRREHSLLGPEEQSDEVVEEVENPKWNSFKAVLLLLLGTLIAAAFADPLVDAVNNFSDATNIPIFFISFIALPLATNCGEAVPHIIFASRKNRRATSLTFSTLYGSATVNNLLCLSVFLALVYVRGLTWDFSSEVLIICIVCLLVGLFGSFRTTFPLWASALAFVLYPFSLALVYVLDNVFGWS